MRQEGDQIWLIELQFTTSWVGEFNPTNGAAAVLWLEVFLPAHRPRPSRRPTARSQSVPPLGGQPVVDLLLFSLLPGARLRPSRHLSGPPPDGVYHINAVDIITQIGMEA